jgi:hypothetical protein
VDQAARTLTDSDQTSWGFGAPRLVEYGVRQTAVGSIDCTTTLSGMPGGPWYNASGLAYVAEQIAIANATIATAKAAGLEIFMASDMFEFPTLFLDAFAANLTTPGVHCIGYNLGPSCISIASNFTRTALTALFRELRSTFPTLDGVVLRYGENSPCAYHQGNAPYDSTSNATAIASLTQLLLFLREVVVVELNFTVIFRTWDTSTYMLHANASFYEAVVSAVPPHPRLVFSIKHTMLDFWRRVRFNPTLGVASHPQIVEAEVGGLYAGCGSWPLYIGDYFLSSYPEDAALNLSYGLPWLVQTAPNTTVGVLMNHQCTTTPWVYDPWIWWQLEERVIANWAAGRGTEPQLFDEAAQALLGVANASARLALRNATVLAMQANLQMITCQAFDETLLEVDRPSANWFGWNGVGGLEQLANNTCHAAYPQHCQVFQWLLANDAVLDALAEKQAAADAMAAVNASLFRDVAPWVPNATVAASLRASAENGAFVSAIVAAGWQVMLWGFVGQQTGVWNQSAIDAGIAAYDALMAQYAALPARYPPLIAPGLMNTSHWGTSLTTPGMDQSIDIFRAI